MKTYKITRVYETYVEVEDDEEIGDEIYAMELEQCNVVEERIELVYARKCDITGEGMNEGWVVNDGEMHFKYEADALQWCIENGYRDIDDAYSNDVIYWTEWEEDNDD